MNRDISMKLYGKCCGRENGKPLGHVTCRCGKLMEHLKLLGLTDAIQRCENRKATNVVFMHITCRVTISNDFQPFVKAGQLSQVSRGVTHEYAHTDTKPTAKSRDIDTTIRAVDSLAENLSFDPAQGTGDLVSLSTRLTNRQGCVTPKQ